MENVRTLRRVLLLPVAGIVIVLVTTALRAQGPDTKPPAFEVASVRANKSGDWAVGGGGGDRFANGQYRTTNIPLGLLIRQAFERWQDDAIMGGPPWQWTDRWDIVAKAASPTAPMLPMIRTLLAERFRLVTHHETRELPIYALVIARRDGRLGPALHASTSAGGFQEGSWVFTARGVPISILVNSLSLPAGRAVIDRTGLAGLYDIELHWTPAGLSAAAGADAPAPASDAPSIFTAVQEQLGLRLESTKAPVDVLVIDHAERPTPD
jgi:uncharacterized protein (TIGR03435 family)